jgi:hypothetical protein
MYTEFLWDNLLGDGQLRYCDDDNEILRGRFLIDGWTDGWMDGWNRCRIVLVILNLRGLFKGNY